MPKNKKKGANKNRRKPNSSQKISQEFKDNLDDEEHLLAVILRRCGGQYIDVQCSDGNERKLYIRNKIKKIIWLNPGDIVFVSRRTDMTNDNKCDFHYKCNSADKFFLKKSNKLDIFNKVSDVNIFAEEEAEQARVKEAERARQVLPQQRVIDLPPTDSSDYDSEEESTNVKINIVGKESRKEDIKKVVVREVEDSSKYKANFDFDIDDI